MLDKIFLSIKDTEFLPLLKNRGAVGNSEG
jgi:hypothetical protein